MASRFDTRWVRSEPLDLTAGDATLRETCEAILPCSAGNVTARLRNDGADHLFVARAYEPIFGDFTIVRRTGTTAAPLYAVSTQPRTGGWTPNQSRGLVHWFEASDPNHVTATPYFTDRASGAVGGLTKGGSVTYNATGFDGVRPSARFAGGTLITPIAASNPLPYSLSGMRNGAGRPMLLKAALSWRTSVVVNKTIVSLGHAAGDSSHFAIETVGAGPGHRVRRANAAGTATNVDATDTIAINTPYLLTVLFNGRYVRVSVGDTEIKAAALIRNTCTFDQLVWGARCTAGGYAQTGATFDLHSYVIYADHDLGRLLNETAPAAHTYLKGIAGL